MLRMSFGGGTARGALAALVLVLTVTLSAAAARADDWIQVSCVNRDGSSAPSQGWSATAGGSPAPGSYASVACGPSTPMKAFLSSSASTPNASENLLYTSPPGSGLVGATLVGSLSADGYGNGAAAEAGFAETSEHDVTWQDSFICEEVVGCGYVGSTFTSGSDWAGTATLGGYGPGPLTVSAACWAAGVQRPECNTGGPNGAFASANVKSAELLLQPEGLPTAQGRFSGSAVAHRVRGTAHLAFTAADPQGPGVYAVTVILDGRVVRSGTPDTYDGACVPVGRGAGGTPMFDQQQPCPPTVRLNVRVPTTGLPDGSHRLVVKVTDAARNTSRVLDRLIRTFNPQTTPRPRRGLRTRFRISWDWGAHTTLLRSITARGLPRAASLRVRCTGRRCPRFPSRNVSGTRARQLLNLLAGLRFHTGDSLALTVRKGRHRPERIVLVIRRDRIPRARLGR